MQNTSLMAQLHVEQCKAIYLIHFDVFQAALRFIFSLSTKLLLPAAMVLINVLRFTTFVNILTLLMPLAFHGSWFDYIAKGYLNAFNIRKHLSRFSETLGLIATRILHISLKTRYFGTLFLQQFLKSWLKKLTKRLILSFYIFHKSNLAATRSFQEDINFLMPHELMHLFKLKFKFLPKRPYTRGHMIIKRLQEMVVAQKKLHRLHLKKSFITVKFFHINFVAKIFAKFRPNALFKCFKI